MSIHSYFETLYAAWGPQHWWPADSSFEIILGAFLTQNTAWTNVEKAMANLRQAKALSLNGLRRLSLEELEHLVRPAGYFRQKAARLKTFIAYLDSNYQGSLAKMFARPTEELRVELLALNGIGPETADSILLYAGQHEVFVVDTYTRRIFERHALVAPSTTYDEIRALVEAEMIEAEMVQSEMLEGGMEGSPDSPRPSPVTPHSPTLEPGPGPAIEAPERAIPPVHRPSKMSEASRSSLAQRYNEFHGLIVQTGKHHCLKRAPVCEGCPLATLLPPGGPKIQKLTKPKPKKKLIDKQRK